MKSYFAKLAARATLANAPASFPIAAPKPHDPFSETSGFVSPTSPHRVEPLAQQRAHFTEPPAPRSVVRDKENIVRQEVSRPLTTSQHERRSQSMTTPVDTNATEQRTSEVSTKSTAQPPLVPRSVDLNSDSSSDQEQPSLKPKQTVTNVKTVSDITHEPEPTVDEKQDNRTQHEETVLLRKADDFMESLFARRPFTARDERNSEREPQVAKPQPVATHEPSPRLQPLLRSPQIPERREDETSLVIENLTVEVVPPPQPQQVRPRHHVVLVRESGNSRRMVPSSRRFGLNHF